MYYNVFVPFIFFLLAVNGNIDFLKKYLEKEVYNNLYKVRFNLKTII